MQLLAELSLQKRRVNRVQILYHYLGKKKSLVLWKKYLIVLDLSMQLSTRRNSSMPVQSY